MYVQCRMYGSPSARATICRTTKLRLCWKKRRSGMPCVDQFFSLCAVDFWGTFECPSRSGGSTPGAPIASSLKTVGRRRGMCGLDESYEYVSMNEYERMSMRWGAVRYLL